MAVPYNVSLSSSTLGKVWRRIVGNTCQEPDPLVGCAGTLEAEMLLLLLLLLVWKLWSGVSP